MSMFTAIIAISSILLVSGTVCKYEELDNAYKTNSKYDGKYTLLNHIACNKRYIYTQNDGIGNMFYLKHKNFTGWVVGTQKCRWNNVDIIGYGDYNFPDQVPNWHERLHTNDGSWTNSSAITVKCTKWLSGWTIFGIVIVSLVLLGLIIALIAGCYSCCTSKQTSSSTSRTSQSNPVSHTNQAYPQVVAPLGSYPPFTPQPYNSQAGTQGEFDKSQEALGATAYPTPPAYTETSTPPTVNPAADTQQDLSSESVRHDEIYDEIPPPVGN